MFGATDALRRALPKEERKRYDTALQAKKTIFYVASKGGGRRKKRVRHSVAWLAIGIDGQCVVIVRDDVALRESYKLCT
jgi:hypothetical protein